MDDWLQLTDEDIERAYRLARENPPTPEVISITTEDIGNTEGQSREVAITITADDLQPAAAPSPVPEAGFEARLERLLLHVVNGTRQHHFPAVVRTASLTWHDDLAAVARQHSADMVKRQYIAHITPEGVTVAQRIRRHGISYLACGENIGVVYGDAAHSERGAYDIHNAFMKQPRSVTNHRGNLLNPIWTHVGIGVAYNPDGALVVTQNFISAPVKKLRQQ